MVGFRNKKNSGLFRSRFSKVSPYITVHEPIHQVAFKFVVGPLYLIEII